MRVCAFYLSDICVQWPDTSCSHMTRTERSVLRSDRETHMFLLRENKHTAACQAEMFHSQRLHLVLCGVLHLHFT